MPPGFTLAHLSDPHLPTVPLPRLSEWGAKRGLGFLNWHLRRKSQHSWATLERLLADLALQPSDHIAVTGDLVNLGLPDEYAAAARWLEAVGPPDRVSTIPGNHDIYVELPESAGVGRWQPYMTSRNAGKRDGFPFVRRLGSLALIGLNSAVPTPPFHAYGRLGSAQRDALAAILDDLAAGSVIRVVLIHHPPLPGLASHRKCLQDAEELAGVLRRHGAELVLHGHNHRAMLNFAEGPRGSMIPVVGVPSASVMAPRGRQTLARYNIYRFAGTPDQPIEMIERGITTPFGPITEIARHQLVAGTTAAA